MNALFTVLLIGNQTSYRLKSKTFVNEVYLAFNRFYLGERIRTALTGWDRITMFSVCFSALQLMDHTTNNVNNVSIKSCILHFS